MADMPGTALEKFELLKAKLIAKGRWDESSEGTLRKTLGLDEVPVAAPAPVVSKSAAKRVRAQHRVVKK